MSATVDFDPSVFLGQAAVPEASSRKLIILNQPIYGFERFALIWKYTSYRICADGGANQLYELLSSQHDQQQEDYLPDLIHGDLDSLRDDVRTYYEDKGVRVSQDSNQYRTDFGKCVLILTKGYADTDHPHLDELGPPRTEGQLQDIIIMSTMAGRMDQALGLLHEMYRETKQHGSESTSPARLWFVSEQSVSFVLPIGRNVIRGIDPKKGIFLKYAGILPIYGPATITLKGFEWDVQDWETKMGGNVSTSNHVLGDEVEVEVAGEMVLFTIEVADINTLES